MHFRLGRSRGSPREEGVHNVVSSSTPPQADTTKPSAMFGHVDFERVKTSPGRDHEASKETTTVEVPQFLPALDPLSDPSSDEYESSPEHNHPNHRHHHKMVSPHQLLAAALHIRGHNHHNQHDTPPTSQPKSPLFHRKKHAAHGSGSNGGGGGLFHRHGSGGKAKLRQQQQPQRPRSRDADSVALGVARGAAQAHADSNSNSNSNSRPSSSSSAKEDQHDSHGFLNILLGEHAQIMEKLHEKAPLDPAVYNQRGSHPVYNKKDGTKEAAAETTPVGSPPMSSLQRRLAQARTPVTPTKKDSNKGGVVCSTPPLKGKAGNSTGTAHTRAASRPMSPTSPNHRHRTQWSPHNADLATNDGDDEEEEADYYEACDEVVTRLGIGRPRYGGTTIGTATSTDAAEASSVASLSPPRSISASAANYPRDRGDGNDDDNNYDDSPVKLARVTSMGSGAIPYHRPISASAAASDTSESPFKLARVTSMGSGAIPTILEESGEEENEVVGEDTAVRRLTFDILPQDMAAGDAVGSEDALADAGSKAGQMIGGRGDDTVSLLTAGSALSSYRRAAEKAAAAERAAAQEVVEKGSPPPPKSSLQRALVARVGKAEEPKAKPSSLQLALAAATSSSHTDIHQPSTPNRSNVTTKSRSLGGGAMTLDGDKEASVDASASRRRVSIATVPAVERVVLPARGGAGIVPMAPAEAAAESRALMKSEVSRHNERRRTASSHKSTVYLLLLDPTQKIFELCSIHFDPSTSTVGSVIDRIVKHATEPGLANLKYSALVRPGDGTVLSRMKDEYKCAPIENGEVLVAVPEWEAPSKCQKIAIPILENPKLKKLLKRARQHREKSRLGSRSRGKSSSRGKSKSRSLENRSGSSSRNKNDAGKDGHRSTSSDDKLKQHSSRRHVKSNTPPTSPLASSSSPSSPSIEDFRRAAVDAASIAATQAVEDQISDLEKRLTDSRERDTRARRELESDLRLQIEARAKVRADIEEHLRLKGEQKPAEEAKPAHLRIEELAQKAKAGEVRSAVSNIAPPEEATRTHEETFSDKVLRKAKHALAKASLNIDADSVKTLTLCLGAAVALRFALWAVDHVMDSLFCCLQQLLAPSHISYDLEIYVPSLADPYGATETNEAFGLAGILFLTCFFAVLIVVQKSVEEKKRVRRMHSSPRRRIRSLIHSPGKSITSASSYHIGSGTMSPRKALKDPWGTRHY
mmetsp:Transcript_9990/g.27976  ORF Transcript_9990/g.27976 Transcript_9990/m.27976 type:complete len:1208 (+) Transcript_9990:261-3884(+)